MPTLIRRPERAGAVLLFEDGQVVAGNTDDMPAVIGGQVDDGKKGGPRVGRSVESVQVRKVAEPHVDPVQSPSGEMVAARARANVREMERDVQTFVYAREVALILPHVEAFAGDAFEKGREGGHHVQLRVRGTGGQSVGDEGGRLLFDADLELVVFGQVTPRLCQLGGSIQVAADHEDLFRKGPGHQRVTGFRTVAGALHLTGSG